MLLAGYEIKITQSNPNRNRNVDAVLVQRRA